MVRREFPEVQIIANPVGLGYARAASQGMEALAPNHRYLLSLSNDVILAPDLVDRLVEAAEANSSIGVLGPKVYFHDRPQILWHAGAHLSAWHGHSYHFGWERHDHPRFDRPRDCAYVTGCGYFLRSELVRRLGYLKADLVFYFEDVDFCYRAREAGYRVVYLPAARLWHKTNTTLAKDRGLQLRYATRNNLYVLQRHRVGPAHFLTLVAHVVGVCPVKMLFFLLLGRWRNARGILRGILDWYRGRYGMIQE
jgi:GT2 family glycosyltransferase